MSNNLVSQDYFQWDDRTGAYATVGVLLDNEILINGEPIAPDDEIGVFTPDGLCVGGVVWCGEENKAITVWGDNIMTEAVDGMSENEEMSFRIWQKSTGKEINVEIVEYERGTGIYNSDNIYVISSLIAFEYPGVPTLVSPGDGATDVAIDTVLVWSKTEDADTYHVQLSEESDFLNTVADSSGMTNTELAVNNLKNSTEYYWRVRAKNEYGYSNWSNTFHFRITDVLTLPVTVQAGWNLVGLPLEVIDADYKSVFPNATGGTLNAFAGGYQSRFEMEPGVGYWLNFSEVDTVDITGVSITELTLTLSPGWNLISGLSSTLPLSSVQDPGNIIIPGTLYGYNGSYEPSDALKPGKGYWLRALEAGDIVLSAAGEEGDAPASLAEKTTLSRTSVSSALESFDRIVIQNANGVERTLYFGSRLPEDFQLQSYSLPPIPMSNDFDVRFPDGYFVSEENEVTVVVQDEFYPLELTFYSVYPEDEIEYIVKRITQEGVGIEQRVVHGESVAVTESDVRTVQLRRVDSNAGQDFPDHYNLSQNYPNPFNPTTTIQYALPADSHVQLEVFNMLGQRVRVLVDEHQAAGYYNVVFDANDLSSGMYIYRIASGEFVDVKKLLYIK